MGKWPQDLDPDHLLRGRGEATLVLREARVTGRIQAQVHGVGRGGRGVSAYHLLAHPCETDGEGRHLPLLSTGVLAVMLLQQVIRWSVEGQALVLFL